MTTSNSTIRLPRHLLRLIRLKGMRFIILYEWMTRLPLKPRAVLTYASLVSLETAKMKTRARDVGTFVQRTPRSVRRHLTELELAGLIVRRPRFERQQQVANAYDLLWHPAMPAELRGARYVADVSGQDDPSDTAREDAAGQRGRSPASAQFMNASGSEEQAGSSATILEQELPPELREGLAKVAPGQLDDCLRIVRDACAAFAPDLARRVRLIALRKLLGRSERNELTNPAGLLRACLVPDALNEVQAITEACSRLRDDIVRGDLRLVRAPSGFAVLRAMRKRALDVRSYVAQHNAAFGTEPDDVPRPCADDPELSELLAEVDKLQELVRAARERDDASTANEAEEGLHRLERSLDQLIQRRRGQVS